METIQEPNRLQPSFIEYYQENVGPLEITEDDYERGRNFIKGLTDLHSAFSGLRDRNSKYFKGRIKGGVMVVEPSSPVRRTVRKEGPFYDWMVKPETRESAELLVIEFLKIGCSDVDPEVLVAEAISPAYRCYGEKPSIEESYLFNPLEHAVAILAGRYSPDTPR